MLLPLLILNLAASGSPPPPPPPAAAASGVPGRRHQWSAIIKGRLVIGSQRDVESALREAARVDAKQVAEMVEPLASNREVRKTARKVAKELVSDAVVFDAPLFDLLGLARRDAAMAAQTADNVREMNRIYMREFEQAMVAQAKQTALEDQEDLEDLAELLEML